MRALSTIVALATTVQLASSQFSGFNYGSTFTTGAPKQQGDFEAEFRRAASLSGAPVGFNSARLYTMVQAGTANDPISAIPAAISTKTTLLLGLWASAGDAAFANELTALKRTIQQYGSSLSGLVAGISVGSEDLYRNSPTGQLNKENPGAEPAKIVDYIRQVREAVAGTPLSGVPIGHVDTWTEWVNLGRNQIVVNAVDFLGFDAYPYFETTAAQGNAIEQNKALFDSALAATRAAAGGRPVWITETGFPVSGKTSGQAVPSIQNARVFWEQVGCSILGKMNVWWYTLQDAAPQTPNPSFGIVNSEGNQLYDLSCTNVGTSTSSTPSPLPPASTGSSNGSGSGSGSPTSRSNDPQPPASSGSGSSTTGTTGGSGGPAPTTGGSGGSAPTTGGSGSSAPTTSRAIDGGSPGAGNGLGSSQLSIQTQTTMTSRSVPTTTGTGSGSGSGSGNGTLSTPSPSPSVPVPGSGASALKKTGSIGAAFAAVLGAALVL